MTTLVAPQLDHLHGSPRENIGVERVHTFIAGQGPVVSASTLGRGAGLALLILGLFLFGSLLVAALVLDSGMLAVGTFAAFSIMSLIGLPLILACVGDALDHG